MFFLFTLFFLEEKKKERAAQPSVQIVRANGKQSSTSYGLITAVYDAASGTLEVQKSPSSGKSYSQLSQVTDSGHATVVTTSGGKAQQQQQQASMNPQQGSQIQFQQHHGQPQQVRIITTNNGSIFTLNGVPFSNAVPVSSSEGVIQLLNQQCIPISLTVSGGDQGGGATLVSTGSNTQSEI
jgi:hypothetical protein